jgi:hypothetical protein
VSSGAQPGRITSTTYALFRVAAGPRIGHGHLRRAEALAGALGRPARISIRGRSGISTTLAAVASAGAGTTLDDVRPRVLILDDPHAAHGQAWVEAATRRQLPVVSLHDLGLARVASTLAVDGSVTSPRRGWPAARTLRGLEYAVIGRPRHARVSSDVRRVLVSLGGGSRGVLTRAVVGELVKSHPGIEVLVTQQCETAGRGRVSHVTAPGGLAKWLARVDVAIVGGGVSLYEAVAAGVPTVAIPIVAAQQPTIRGFALRRLALDAGGPVGPPRLVARCVAQRFARLVRDADLRQAMHVGGPVAVDGRGAQRVARAIVALTEATRRG